MPYHSSGGSVARSAVVTLSCVAGLAMLAGCAIPELPASNVPQRQGAVPGVGPAPADVLPLPEAPSLEDYLRYAEENNPALGAALERHRAAVGRVVAERTLPDPMLRFSTDLRVGTEGYGLGLEQMFPWAGKLALRGQAAWEEAEAARYRYEVEKLKLFRMVKEAYYEYYYLGRQIAVVREQREFLKYMEEALRTRYAASAAGYSEVVRVQVELGRMDNELRTLADLQGPAAARLNSLLNRPPSAAVPWPAEVPSGDMSIVEEEVLRTFPESNPELSALQHEIAAGGRAVQVAQRDYYPDVTLGLEFIESSRMGEFGMGPGEKDPLVAMLAVNLPIWRQKLRAVVSQAQARHREALHARREMENQLAAEIKMVLYQVRDANRRIDLYRDTLVPKGKQSVKASEAAFRAGTGTFLEVLDAVRILLEFELEHERALADQGVALGRLEELVGKPVAVAVVSPSPEGPGLGEEGPKSKEPPE